MPKVTVYVPDELKARMDAVGEANWSAAAQEAFAGVVKGEEWKMQTDLVEQAVVRLRASKGRYTDQERARGQENGRSWALKMADYEELTTLSELCDRDGVCTYSAWEIGEKMTEGHPYDFWDGEMPSEDYAHGFVKGAIEVFKELKSRL